MLKEVAVEEWVEAVVVSDEADSFQARTDQLMILESENTRPARVCLCRVVRS